MENSRENQQVESPLEESNELFDKKMQNKSLFNIILMSVSFLFIFTAFNSSSLIQKIVVDNINRHNHSSTKNQTFNNDTSNGQSDINWNAYASLSTIYGVFSFSNFLVPSILSAVSSARCLFFSSLTYLIYTIAFIHPVKYSLYVVSVILGFGAAVIWTSQGNYLTENSDSTTIDRNTGIFWAIFQGSLVFGNLFLYFKFSGKNEIDDATRIETYLVLAITCGIGCFMLLFLNKTTTRSITTDSSTLSLTNPVIAFKKCLKLFKTKKMLLLSVACFYSGLELSFYGGVYSAVISLTKSTYLGNDTDKLMGIYGCFVGTGSIIGGLLFGLSGKRFVQNNRSRVFILGFIVHMIAYFLIFLNHPNESSYIESKEQGYITPVVWIEMLNGFLLGFGDACFNTQIISLIGCVYTDDSNYTSSAFALYKFTQSIAAAISFLYSSHGVGLYFHLIILVIFAVFGSISFVLVELFVKREIE